MNEDKKGEKTVEEKIDWLIAESEKAKVERKRERVLSKVDGLYNVLIALSTFLIGLVISQHGFFVNASSFGLFVSVSGIILSMIVSYVVGFMGMVKDSIETRILSWGLFLTSVTLLGISYVISFVSMRNDIVSGLERVSVGLVCVYVILGFSSKIVTLVEAKYSLIIGQETHEWVKIRKNVIFNVGIISTVIFLVTFSISVVVVILIGML